MDAITHYLSQVLDLVSTRGTPATITLILVLVLLRLLAGRHLRHDEDLSDEVRLKWANIVKNTSYLVGIAGVILIWAPQIQTFALSLTAFAVAIVIATKELILCLSGTLLRASNRPFNVGDIIEVGDHMGYVIDQSLVTTTIKEQTTDFYSSIGKTVTIPNSLFLNTPIRNHSVIRPYMIHSFHIWLEPDPMQVEPVHEMLTHMLDEYWGVFQRENPRFLTHIRNRRLIQQDAIPKVRFSTNDIAKFSFTVTFPCRAESWLDLEQKITREVFRLLQKMKETGSAS